MKTRIEPNTRPPVTLLPASWTQRSERAAPQKALGRDERDTPGRRTRLYLLRGFADVRPGSEVLDRRKREDGVERIVRGFLELCRVHVLYLEVRLAVGVGRERRRVAEHRSICFLVAEAALAVDVGRDDLRDPVREPEQHGLVPGAGGEDPRVLAEQLPELSRNSVSIAYSQFLRCRRSWALESGHDVVDPRADGRVVEATQIAQLDVLPLQPGLDVHHVTPMAAELESRLRSASTIISASSRNEMRGAQPSFSRALDASPTRLVHLGGAEEFGIDDDVLVDVDARVLEGDLGELADRVLFAGRDHVVVGLVGLQHQPHRLDVVARVTPVALRVEVPQPQLYRRAPA